MSLKNFFQNEEIMWQKIWQKIKSWLNWEMTTDDDAYQQVVLWILPYRARLTGNNRFLISVAIIQEAFPEFSTQQILDIWYKLTTERNYVETDPFDGAWVIKP